MKKSEENGLFKVLITITFLWFVIMILLYPTPDQIETANDKIVSEIPEFKVMQGNYFTIGYSNQERKFYELGKSGEKKLTQITLTDSNKPAEVKKNLTTVGYPNPPPNIFGDGEIGEMGKPVNMPISLTPGIQKIVDDGWKQHAFNQYVSDLISLKRSLPDYRADYCREIEASYSKNLPATSVIIIFHNEAWSTLLRSVHSILDRSPEHLITEIILVDDCSELDHLKKPLEQYFESYPKVKILRADKREGLIRARLRGAAVAKGPVLTFFDSHIECTTGWLEPLLNRIAENSTNVVCPVIEIIKDDTLEFTHTANPSLIQVGGFDWRLSFRWHLIPNKDVSRKDPSEPLRSPTMAGGLFAIDKKFFEKLGMYDPEFDIWGAENLEISFKTWMCGGVLEIIPCSRVGHVFRKVSPYKWRSGVDAPRRNSIRLAEVWMDDHAKFYYSRAGIADKGNFGNISERIELREKLQCKSFKWYLDNVYPEQFDPSTALAQGSIRSLALQNNSCISFSEKDIGQIVGINPCVESISFFWYTSENELRRDDHCLDYSGPEKGVITYECHHKKGTQYWTFLSDTNQIFHNTSSKCLAVDIHNQKLIMEKCVSQQIEQKWMFFDTFNNNN